MISRNTDKLIGQTFDNKYRIIELIDRGAMGSVYKAEHVLMGRIVALKVIRAGRGEDEDIARYLTRFEREARTTSQIDHPNAITIHDYGVDGDVPYLVMQYLEGTSLKQELTKRGRLSFSRTADIVEQVAGALDAAHKLQIIHRDLKPENIMLRRVDGVERVEVLDFGIAKVLDDESAVSVTGNGDAIGTPQYMSPEAVQGEDVGPASDIYALAVVAYEMLTGRVPFQADTAIAMLCKHVIEEPPPMRSHCKIGIPEQADEVILRALSKSPAERPTSALAFAAELRQALNIGSSQYEAAFFGNSASAIPKHRSAPALLAAIGLLMVLAGTAFIVSRVMHNPNR